MRLRDLFTRRRSTGTGAVRVEYSPTPNGRADPGEVVWAWVPYEDDPAQGKDRPVLVIGRAGRTLVAVPLSSQDHDDRRDASEWVEIGTGAWDRQRRPSEADAGRLLRYGVRDVRREGGVLPRERFDAVIARARQLHPDQLP